MKFSTIVTLVFVAATQGAASSTELRKNVNKTQAFDCAMQLTETQLECGDVELNCWECAADDGCLLDADVPYAVDDKDPEAKHIESGVTRLHAEKAVMSTEKTLPKLKTGITSEKRGLLKTEGAKRSVLVVRVEAKDGSPTPSEEDLAEKVLGIKNSTDATDTSWNVVNAMDQCSYGKVKLEPAQNTDVNNGVITITIDQNAKGARNVDVLNTALNELRSRLGTNNLNALHDHFMLCMPPGTVTNQGYAGWSGFGIINGAVAMFNDNWCTKTSLQMHEIVRNLGLRHGGENGDKHADYSEIMGHSFNHDAPVMCYNPAKNWLLGWYEDKHTIVKPLIQNFWEGEIYGYTDHQNAGTSSESPIILKVEGHNKEYFIGFDHTARLNTQNQEIDTANKITVHSVGTAVDESSLEAKLGLGEHFEIPDFGGGTHSVIVQVVDIDMSANPPIAKVSVNLMKVSSDSDYDDGSVATTCALAYELVFKASSSSSSGTSWKLAFYNNPSTVPASSNGKLYSPGSSYAERGCIPKDCYEFQIFKAESYSLRIEGKIVAGKEDVAKETEVSLFGKCSSSVPTTCALAYELVFKASSSSSSGTYWKLAFYNNPSTVPASSNGKLYSPGSSYVEKGCIPKDCYRFQIFKAESYSLRIEGKIVAGKDDVTKETEVSLFGKCSTM